MYIYTIVHRIIEYIEILYCLLTRLGLHPLLNSPLDYPDREIGNQIDSLIFKIIKTDKKDIYY